MDNFLAEKLPKFTSKSTTKSGFSERRFSQEFYIYHGVNYVLRLRVTNLIFPVAFK